MMDNLHYMIYLSQTSEASLLLVIHFVSSVLPSLWGSLLLGKCKYSLHEASTNYSNSDANKIQKIAVCTVQHPCIYFEAMPPVYQSLLFTAYCFHLSCSRMYSLLRWTYSSVIQLCWNALFWPSCNFAQEDFVHVPLLYLVLYFTLY